MKVDFVSGGFPKSGAKLSVSPTSGRPASCMYWLKHDEAAALVLMAEHCALEVKKPEVAVSVGPFVIEALRHLSRTLAQQWLEYEKLGPDKTEPRIVREIEKAARARRAR